MVVFWAGLDSSIEDLFEGVATVAIGGLWWRVAEQAMSLATRLCAEQAGKRQWKFLEGHKNLALIAC